MDDHGTTCVTTFCSVLPMAVTSAFTNLRSVEEASGPLEAESVHREMSGTCKLGLSMSLAQESLLQVSSKLLKLGLCWSMDMVDKAMLLTFQCCKNA